MCVHLSACWSNHLAALDSTRKLFFPRPPFAVFLAVYLWLALVSAGECREASPGRGNARQSGFGGYYLSDR